MTPTLTHLLRRLRIRLAVLLYPATPPIATMECEAEVAAVVVDERLRKRLGLSRGDPFTPYQQISDYGYTVGMAYRTPSGQRAGVQVGCADIHAAEALSHAFHRLTFRRLSGPHADA
jgi:hypothetical protein